MLYILLGFSTCSWSFFVCFWFFFFNDTATTEIYTLSLHDALPIFHFIEQARRVLSRDYVWISDYERSEEHTSELQSREKHVCRLLLEKKKKKVMWFVVSMYDISISSMILMEVDY